MPQHEIRHLPHLATFYGEFSQEKIADEHAWADLVFFHHKDEAQDYPTKQEKVALSVWYQSGPFISHATQEDWDYIKAYKDIHGHEEAVRFAVEDADLGYIKRWKDNHARMIEKEKNEQVPPELRMSDMMEIGREVQLQRTMNHPTSLVFREWALRICTFLDEKPGPRAVTREEALADNNIAGLPCEDHVTSGARKHLGLKWGDGDQFGREYAAMKIYVE